jgi:branched-chain amino acid transport system substrate-binding protein
MSMVRLFVTLAGVILASVLALAQSGPVSNGAVKIGVLGDMAGLYQDTSGKGAVEAVKLAVEDFGGAVLGRPIEIVSADHQNKPDIASSVARRWYDSENVDMIVDMVGSASALAVTAVSNDKRRIAMVSNASATDISGKQCTPYSTQYNFDTYALAKSTTNTLLKQGQDTFFFITADYTFGHNLENDVTRFVREGGGKVLGSVKHPIGTSDFSSYLLTAQASGAKVIALANASSDTINAIKTAQAFNVTAKQKLAGMLIFLSDIHAIGLQTAQGLIFTDSFYWDMNDETRAWSRRFFDRVGRMPNNVHAADYSATLQYLKAVQAAGTDNSDAVMATLKKIPINDMYTKNSRIREDGMLVHDLYLFQVKMPAESTGPWDYYKLLATIPADEAFRPLSESACYLVKPR